MTEQEALKYAQLHYPIGTIYKGLRDGKNRTADIPAMSHKSDMHFQGISVGYDWIYRPYINGEIWAEIMEIAVAPIIDKILHEIVSQYEIY